MPTGGVWVIAAVGVLVLFCAAMWAYHTWKGRRTDRELDAIERRINRVSARLDAVRQHLDGHITDMDMDEVELRAHMDYDAYRFGYRLPGERAL